MNTNLKDSFDEKPGSPLHTDKTAGPARQKAGVSGSSRQVPHTRYLRNSRTISGRLHDELVMMDPDQGKYFSLNPVATRIWDLLENPLDIEELCGLLMAEYDVQEEQCRSEVSEVLQEMVKLRVVAETA